MFTFCQGATVPDDSKKLLSRVRWFSSWSKGNGESQVQDLRARASSTLGSDTTDFDDAVALGRQICAAVEATNDCIFRRGTAHSQALELIEQYREQVWSANETANRDAVRIFNKHLAKALAYHAARERRRAQRAAIGVRSSVQPGEFSHQIDELAPASGWDLVIDETGRSFDPRSGGGHNAGKFVGILLPHGVHLPAQAGFHGVEATDDETDSVLQTLLDSQAAVFGLSNQSVAGVLEKHWQAGVHELVEWVVRLLPAGPGRPKLRVHVEQRGSQKSGAQWEAAVVEMERQFAKRAPHLASKVELSIRVVSKDGHPALPYADAVAFTWGSPTQSSQLRLEQSGLMGSCLFDHNLQSTADAWDTVASGGQLDRDLWSDLLVAQARDQPLPRRVLELAGGQLSTPDVIRHYQEVVETHLNSKAVHLDLLGLQIEWLHEHAATDFGPRAQLVALSSRLARDNHVGAVDQTAAAELERLNAELFDEDAPLCCLADLRRIVAHTNAYEFDAAQRILDPWLGLAPAIPGLQMWGRVLSTAGQLCAFDGRHDEACQYFRDALDVFGRLSDAAAGDMESGQTSAYLAIAAMDDEETSREVSLRALLDYLGVATLEQAITELANNVSPVRKYHHHILTRYLVLRGGPDAQATYLAALEQLDDHGVGHPWPLVLFYRAWMQQSAGTTPSTTALQKAAAMALHSSSGPTLTLIGATIEALASRWGSPLFDEQGRAGLRKLVAQQLPEAAERLRQLEDLTASDADVLRRVLPFNFH